MDIERSICAWSASRSVICSDWAIIKPTYVDYSSTTTRGKVETGVVGSSLVSRLEEKHGGNEKTK